MNRKLFFYISEKALVVVHWALYFCWRLDFRICFRFQFLRMLGCVENISLNNLERAHKIQKFVRKRMQKTPKIVWFCHWQFLFFHFYKKTRLGIFAFLKRLKYLKSFTVDLLAARFCSYSILSFPQLFSSIDFSFKTFGCIYLYLLLAVLRHLIRWDVLWLLGLTSKRNWTDLLK